MSNNIWNEKVVFVYLGLCVCVVCNVNKEKEARYHEFEKKREKERMWKSNEEVCIEAIQGRKRKG